ncbi:hypothetical protein EPUS_03314 [Endocarpon pusillum Z07020]|uniref:Uncharacterized protein n=1 Tax=Endocarpon pusillum (strain Z07020 / HMAS-L-300199) TaxID=1263415 RepID=U1HPP7_ENDPU|nr:uncharacterized protein EPUS_03314 [Endocarpon pusillum Z07020]ERF71034.1 hypothetical protein EPUS_03314 [Endocarpon pusillum Z07020]
MFPKLFNPNPNIGLRIPPTNYRIFAKKAKLQDAKPNFLWPIQQLKKTAVNLLKTALTKAKEQPDQLHFTLSNSPLAKNSQKKPDQTSPRERAKTAALHENSKNFLPAILDAFLDGKNCEDEDFPVRLWTGPTPSTCASSNRTDSTFADPHFKPKPLECMSAMLKDWPPEKVTAYFAWCENTAWDPPDEDAGLEYDPDNPLPSKFVYESFFNKANNQDGDIMDVDQNLPAEDKAEDPMTGITGDLFAEPEDDEEMTDSSELPIEDWYDSTIAPFTTRNRNLPALLSVSKPRHSVEAVPRHQDMNNVAATGVPGLGMLEDDNRPQPPLTQTGSSGATPGLSLFPGSNPSQPPCSDQSDSPRAMSGLNMLQSESQPEQHSSSKAPKASPSQSKSYPLAPVTSVTQHESFFQYRHTPLVRLSSNRGSDTATSSVPGLDNEVEDQTFGPDPLSPEGQPSMIALRGGIITMSIKSDRGYDLFKDVPLTAGVRRRMPADYMLYPMPKRICLPAKSSSSTDESASKTRRISGIHDDLLEYQNTESDQVAASQTGSRTKSPGNAKSSSALQGRRMKVPSRPSALSSKGAIRPGKAVSLSALRSKVRPAMQSGAGLHKEFGSRSFAPQAIKKQATSSSAAANHSSQQAVPPSTKFAPSKKPGSFGTSTSKSNAIPSNSIASGSDAMGIDTPPTASSQSAKPSSTGVNNQMSNVVASSPDAHGLLSSGLGSTSTHFVQPKKPGTWLNPKPKRDAVPVVPAAPVVATSERSDSTMGLDVPVSSASASSNESVAAVQVDKSKTFAPKPFTPVPAGDGRATRGSGTARRAGQAPARRAAPTGKNISEARHIGRTKGGFRDRSDKERKELEGMLNQVPDQFKIDVHKVIQSQVCDTVPGLSDERVRSIPDLAKTGVGASVGPHPFADKFRSKADNGRDIAYFRELRQEMPQVWLHLITMVLQSGRSPKDIFDNECDAILGAEWVTDLERIDRVAREGSAADSKAFFTREDVSMTLRPTFDHAVDKMTKDGCKVFEMAVKNWVKHDKSGGNKDLFLQCLERAGWIQAHSHLTRFMGWATGDAPPAIKRACFNHFRWAFPRMLRAVSTERLEKTQPSTVG